MCVVSVLQSYVRLECERERSIPFVATGFSKRKVLESCLGSAQWADGGNAQAVQLPPADRMDGVCVAPTSSSRTPGEPANQGARHAAEKENAPLFSVAAVV
jgi:hypothetical protein